nr:hypothetical protein CFP56_07567 [Quercus suber]
MTSSNQVAMAADGLADGNTQDAIGQSVQTESKAPIIVSANRYFDIKPYMDINYTENPKKWGAIFPWEFPQNATQEQEDAFLIQQFGELECNVQGFKFLKQCWYCAALHNYENRVPLVARDWRLKNESFYDLDKPAVLEAMCKDNAEPIAFFPEEMDLYGEKFLRVVMEAIQVEARTLLATIQCSPQAAPLQQAQTPAVQQYQQLPQPPDTTPKSGHATASGDEAQTFDAPSNAPGTVPPVDQDEYPEHFNLVPAKHEVPNVELLKEADKPAMPAAHETESNNIAKPMTVTDNLHFHQHIGGDALKLQGYREYGPRFGYDRDNVSSAPYENKKNRRQYHHQVNFSVPHATSTQSQKCDGPPAIDYTEVGDLAEVHSSYGVPPIRASSHGFIDHRPFQAGLQGQIAYNEPDGKDGIYVPRSLMELPHHDMSYPFQRQDLQQMSSYDQGGVATYSVPPHGPVQAHQPYEGAFQEKTNHRSQTYRKFSTGSGSQYGDIKVRRYGQYSHHRGTKARGSSREYHGRKIDNRFSSRSNYLQKEQIQVDCRNPADTSSAMPDQIAAAEPHYGNDYHHRGWRSMVPYHQEESTTNNDYAMPSQPMPSHRQTQMHSNDSSYRPYRLGSEHKLAKGSGVNDRSALYDGTINTSSVHTGPTVLYGRVIPSHLLNSQFIHPDITHVTKVIIFGIATTVPRPEVEQLFGQFGKIAHLRTVSGVSSPMMFITYENTVQVRTALTHDGMTLPDGKTLRVQVPKEYWLPTFRDYPGQEFMAMPHGYKEFWTRSELPMSHDASPHASLTNPLTSLTTVPGQLSGYMNPGSLAKASDNLMPNKDGKGSLRKQASTMQKKGKLRKNQRDSGDVKDKQDDDHNITGLQQPDMLGGHAVNLQAVPTALPDVSPNSKTKPHSDEPLTQSTCIAVSKSTRGSELEGTATDVYAVEANVSNDQSSISVVQSRPFRDETTTPEKEHPEALVSQLPEHEPLKRSASRGLDESPDEKSFHTATDSPESSRNQALANIAKYDEDESSRTTPVDVILTPTPAQSKATPLLDSVKAPVSSLPVPIAYESNATAAQSVAESALAESEPPPSGEGQDGLSSNSGIKQGVETGLYGAPEGCDTSAMNQSDKPHASETVLSPKSSETLKNKKIEKPLQVEKKKGPAQTESLSAFGKQVKSKGGRAKSKGPGLLKGKPKSLVDQKNKSLVPETVQPSLGRLDSSDTKVLPELLTEPKKSVNVNELSKPIISHAIATATAFATAHGDEDEEANNNHNANDSDDKHMTRRSSFFDRVKDITKTGQRSRLLSLATSPHESYAIETTNESDRPVFWGKTSEHPLAIIQHIPGTAPLAPPGASHAVPVAELTDSGKIPVAAQPPVPEDDSFEKGGDIGLGISSADGDGKGAGKPKPKKKKKKSEKKRPAAQTSSVLDTESETRDDTSGVRARITIIVVLADRIQIKSRSHSFETIAMLDMATPESSTPSSPDVSATAASPSPSKAMMFAALKAKRESEQHLITASDSGTIKRKKLKKRVTSVPKTTTVTAEQAGDEDNVHTITILTTKRARESQGEPPPASDGGDDYNILLVRYLWFGSEDVGRGATVLSRIASSLGEQSQGGLLMSLLKDRDEEPDTEDESAAGSTEQRKDGDDDAESTNRIEELP